MRILISAVLLAAVVTAQAPKVKPPPEEAAAGFATINPEDCKTWLTRLASDEFEGRDSGTPGFQKAAEMVAAHFKELGLKAIADKDKDGNPTYFQNVPFVASGLESESARFEVTGGKAPIVVKPGEGFGATGAGTLAANGPLAFVFVQPGQGKLPELDVKGRVVIAVCVDGEGAIAAMPRGMLSDLRKPGPAAVVRVDDVVAARGMGIGTADRKDRVERGERAGGRRSGLNQTPSPYVSRAVAESLAAAAGKDFAALLAKAKGGAEPQTITTKLNARVDLASKVTDIPVPNVVGYLEGSDPALKNELVIIGSHLDHLGRNMTTGEVFNGADDDGSGSTGLLAVSRAFAKNTRAPKRSVLFLAFCGEEKGLLGSEWYVEHPLFPHANVIAEIQMDMIGRHEEAVPGENPGNETAEDNVNTLHLVGAKRIAPALNDLIERVNSDHTGFVFEYDQEGVYERSDHYHFARKGIPIAFFFTGFHRDYHKPTDDVEKIDFAKLARVAQLVYLIGFELGDRNEKLPIEKSKKPPR
jgi:Peptidase family M28